MDRYSRSAKLRSILNHVSDETFEKLDHIISGLDPSVCDSHNLQYKYRVVRRAAESATDLSAQLLELKSNIEYEILEED